MPICMTNSRYGSHFENISKMFPFMFETKFLISSNDYCITRTHTQSDYEAFFFHSPWVSFVVTIYVVSTAEQKTRYKIYSTKPGANIVMRIKCVQCLLNESSTDLLFPEFLIILIPRALFIRFLYSPFFRDVVHLFYRL